VGLLAGASTAIVIATIHFLSGFAFPAVVAYFGLGCVVIGLLHIPLLRTSIPLLRCALNAILVSGFALALVGIDGRGLELNLMTIGLCIFWMFTRAQLSSWDHERIQGCGHECGGKGERPNALKGRLR